MSHTSGETYILWTFANPARACDRSKGYIGFGWGSPDYQVVCDSGTEDGVECPPFP